MNAPTFKVTACWYETVYVDAEDEADALDIAYRESFRGQNYVGSPDDYEITPVGDDNQT